MDAREIELTPSERTGLLAWLLARGDTFTAKEAAVLAECHEDTARRILNRLARVLPIFECNGVFQVLVDDRDGGYRRSNHHPSGRVGKQVRQHRTPERRR